MPRTTLNIDAPVLKDLKRLQKRMRKALGRLASDLLAETLAAYKTGRPSPPAFQWISRPMGARVDLADKEAVYDALDKSAGPPPGKGPRS